MSYLQDTTLPLDDWLVISTADGVYKSNKKEQELIPVSVIVFLLADDCILRLSFHWEY